MTVSREVLREWACVCAEAVLPVWEAAYPHDRRVHAALDVARTCNEAAQFGAELDVYDAMVTAEDDGRWAAARAACAALQASRTARSEGAWVERGSHAAARHAAQADGRIDPEALLAVVLAHRQ